MRLRSSGVHRRGRRFLDQLLVTALDGAFALAQNFHVAMVVGENLKLDVARILDQLLHVHIAVGKRRGGFGLGLRHQVRQFLGAAHHAHAAAAAPAEAFIITG